MVDKGASDIYFTVGAPPNLKVEGILAPIGQTPLQSSQMQEIAHTLMNEAQRNEFANTLELNMAYMLPNIGRFRVNVFRQCGEIAVVIRLIKERIPSFLELMLPDILTSIMMELHGLVLVVGATGSGKSTTLASMIDYRNAHYAGHILTIEDPIEFIHHHKQSLVNQREIGIDTHSYDNALKNALREAPDVILIGEVRDNLTMKYALAYAETGHLCISTMHANNANQALERVLSFFKKEARQQILNDLSSNLKAVISLRLIPGLTGKRVPAVEILLNTPFVSSLIEKGKVDEIKEAMEKNELIGMQTFDQSLLKLYAEGFISKENAIHYADSKNNVSLQIRLNEEKNFDGKGLSLQKDDDEFH